ncbi:hypothetical protein ACSXAY_10265 [Clostridium perfringens]
MDKKETNSTTRQFIEQEKNAKEKFKEGTLEYVNNSLGINLTEEQFLALAIFDFTTKEYRLVEILKVLKILNII